MTGSLRIIVVQGHRNSSGGNPFERAKTPAIANAIVAALTRAGHRAVALQNGDGSSDDWFDGSLDAVARRVMHLHRTEPVDLMLDIHIESDPASTPGVFTIVPDGDGLKTLTPYAGTDRATPGSRDRRFATAIASEIARCTGLRLRTRTVIEPGVMSERQTHVGADLGWRLAMFGYTAPARHWMARLVIECGNLTADARILDRADFPHQVARGVVAGVTRAGGWSRHALRTIDSAPSSGISSLRNIPRPAPTPQGARGRASPERPQIRGDDPADHGRVDKRNAF